MSVEQETQPVYMLYGAVRIDSDLQQQSNWMSLIFDTNYQFSVA